MSFQPPPAEVAPEPSVDTPRRFSGQAASAAEPAPEHPFHDRSDFKWPKDRIAKREDRSQAGAHKRRAEGGRRVQGTIKRHPDGYGFLIPDQPDIPDVYISRYSMNGVMTNDKVEAEVHQARGDKGGDRLFGEVRKVVKRANTKIVGRYLPVDQKYGVILDEGRGWGADLRIQARDSMGAQENDLVAVEITQFPDEGREFRGRVVEKLGDMDDPLNDVKRVIYQHRIPEEFSRQAFAEARSFGGEVTEKEMKGREDLRSKTLITIDGATARDFDDAIFVEQTPTGFHLIVGIADVSHYVKPGTKLDQEAYERGTSTYFPNFVVPMLPEELSNELCSLKPHVPRLCFACEMHLNFQGDVTSYRFFEAVMESKARVTYGEAQEVLDGNTPEKLKHVEENILRAGDLAKILMAKRFREGSLDLEIPETQVVVDSTGESIDVIKAARLFAHRLIEELMLVTNICTARFLDENDIPGIYRIHEEPDPENIRALQRYLWNLGGSRSIMGDRLQKKLSAALEAMQGKPGAQVLNILTLRSMNQAKYSEQNIGHFGLGFSHYSHFTSPIRRYPDLIAHRLIKSQIYPRYRTMQMTEEELASAGTFLSACEQRSVKAERQLISIKKARFMKRFVGQEFEGIISSVAKFGVFVLLRQFDIDGLVKMEELGDDRFVFDDESLRLIGNRTGIRYTIGDSIRVMVANVDIEDGKIDFILAEGELERLGFEVEDESLEGNEEFDIEEFAYRGETVRIGGKHSKQSKKAGPSQGRRVHDREGRREDRKEGRQEHRQDNRKGGRRRASKKAQQMGGQMTGPAAGREQGPQPGKGGPERKREEPKRGADKSAQKDRVDVQKRGKAADDRRRVRKERVSKRRRKD